MVKPLTFDQIRAQIPKAVRETFSTPKDQKLSPKEIARSVKSTPLEAAMAKLPSNSGSGAE